MALAGILLLWAGVRTLVLVSDPVLPGPADAKTVLAPSAIALAARAASPAPRVIAAAQGVLPLASLAPPGAGPVSSVAPVRAVAAQDARAAPRPRTALSGPGARFAAVPQPYGLADSNAAFQPAPPGPLGPMRQPSGKPSPRQVQAREPMPPPSNQRRWSGDGWVYLRRGQSVPPLGGFAPSYGASQYGLVVRRDLSSGSRARIQAYARVAGAIDAPATDRQFALGLAARPFSGLPAAVMVEGRAQQGTVGTRLRPAMALVSEIPPVRLPLGLEGDIYGQAGWVGGQDATAFFDLQASAQRTLLTPLPRTELRFGAGAWSGGQRDAVRLDVGPRVSLRTRLGPMPASLSVDWRFRVAGDAAPGSGPAVTLATGF